MPKVDFDRNGPWLAIAMLKGEDGLEASRVPSPVVGAFPRIPKVGEKAPVIHTPTAADVGGDMAKIDTRVPPDQMHEVDFADAVGKKPIVLVFATPALCQSRVCGPVVDVAQQVADAYKGKADFIHMEICNDNDISKGIAAPGAGLPPGNRALDLPDRPQRNRPRPHRGRLWRVRTGRSDAEDRSWLSSQAPLRFDQPGRGPARLHPLGGRVEGKTTLQGEI